MFRMHRAVSFKAKNNIIAVYHNENLYFFKNKTAVWFRKIVNNEIGEVPLQFNNYLCNEGILIIEN